MITLPASFEFDDFYEDFGGDFWLCGALLIGRHYG